MSSGSVKRLLRSARECLGRREYREALQHCKEVLAEDKSCYEAYIFVGKAAFHLQEHTQAEAAYRRASDLDSHNPLAWQGLSELFTETGAWPAAADSYAHLLQLTDAAPPDDPLRARRPTFLRRYAEAAARGGLLGEAEAAWRALGEAAEDAAEAAAAAAAGAGAGEEQAAAAAAAEGELLDCLCRLADVQLAADAAEVEARVAARLAVEAASVGALTPDQLAALESNLRTAVEGEWAEEALELDADHASATLRRIIALRPPCPPIAPYYDAFLKRLRKYIQAAPPGSMDRHSRRAVLLAAAKATMDGRCGDRAGGCCSPYAFEAALAMLELEHEVVGAEDPSLDPANPSPTLEPPPLPLLVADCGRIAARLMHCFPWSPTAQLHNALSLRRRAAVAGFDAQLPGGAGAEAGPVVVVRLPAAGGGAVGRHRQVTALLLSALSRGGRGVSGWLAACEMLLEEGAAEAALDAAKEGLKYVAHRDLVGKERLAGPGLLLRLLAGQALLRLRKLDEAELLLEGLATGVSEGHVASGELAGIAPTNVSQQAKRYMAHVAAARGDLPGCRHRYDELVGGQLMGRSAAPIEAWAHGELGMLLLRQGGTAMEGARFHLQAALQALQGPLEAAAAAAISPAATALVALQHEAAAYQLHLALALWVKGGGRLQQQQQQAPEAPQAPQVAGAAAEGGAGGGEAAAVPAAAPAAAAPGPSLEPFRSECRDLLLGAAAIPGPLQAAAFTWLGHWYDRAADPRDVAKARRCYQRALALDPTQSEAGEALVAALVAAGRADTARLLCEEMQARAAAAATAAAYGGRAAEPAASALGAPSPFLIHPRLMQDAAATAAAAAAGAAGGGGGGGESPATSGAGGGGGGGRAGWALRCLARLQRDAGTSEAAVTSYQSALRLDPEDAELWEGLAASYQALGRHTAALKSYGRALELSPGRLFSRLQAAALHYQMGSMPDALSYYRTALRTAPANAAALLGCGEVLLAQAALAARMGAGGAAAAELADAAALAERATRLYGNLQAGWKLLGDVRMQHAAVPTLESVAATRGSLLPPSASGAVEASLAAARERLARLRSARRSYAAAVHLDPRVAGLWGDLGMSYHLELELAGQHPGLEREGELQRDTPAALRRRALALARGGLRLAPDSDWLWGSAGAIAAAAAAAGAEGGEEISMAAASAAPMAAAAEYCFSRALQLNPRRAGVWAALGRLYAAHGEGGLASRCFDFARSHEPTSIAVWEAMGDAALRRAGVAAGSAGAGGVRSDPRFTAAWRDAADAYEHAQLLGGDVESRLGYVLGRLVLGGDGAAAEGSVLAAASKAAAMQPLQPAAHHARGLALEARGDYAAAVQAFQTALQLLQSDAAASSTAAAAPPPSLLPSSVGLSPRPLATPFDPRVCSTAIASVQLDLARALAAAGGGGRAAEAVALYDKLRQEGFVRQEDYGAKLSYGMALLQVKRSAEAQAQLSDLAAASAAPARLRLAAATTLVRQHVAARRWDEAYGTVLGATAELPDEGPAAAAAGAAGAVAESAARLWLIVLAGIVTARALELEPELLTAMRQWAAGRKDLDTAQLECRVQELLCAKHRAAGAPVAALRQAARAVHVCPYDRAARALLAHTALAAGPRYAALAARAAPRDRPPYSAAATGENAAPGVAAAEPPPLVPSAAAAQAAAAAAMPTAAAAAAAGTGGGGAAVATAGLEAAVQEAAARMRRVVHSQPWSSSAWYLCALTGHQRAVASGGQARMYRSAAAAARTAALRVKAELQSLPPEPSAAAAAAAAAGGTAAVRPPMVPPGMPPALAMAMAAQAARAQAAAATDSRVAAHRAQRAVLADTAVRSLALLSECQLHLRNHTQSAVAGEEEAAAEALRSAEEALGLASTHGADASPAHRQLARVRLAQGNFEAAEAAYDQAARAAKAAAAAAASSAPASSAGSHSYALLPVLEWVAVRATTGRPAEALQLLSTWTTTTTASAAAMAASVNALTDVAAVQRALLLLQLGESEAAREAAVAAAAAATSGGLEVAAAAVTGVRSAANVVQAAAALVQASLLVAAEGEPATGGAVAPARKKCLLEARWAAREALKPLTVSSPAGPLGYRFPRGSPAPPGVARPSGALASLVLGAAEAALGKADAAKELLDQAHSLWPHKAAQPPETVAAQLGNGSGSSGGSLDRRGRCREAHAVHSRPWALGATWSGLVAAARAT